MRLDEYAKQEPERRRSRWVDRLPDEVQAEIIESPAPPQTIVRWLESIGYPDCTPERLRPLLRERRS